MVLRYFKAAQLSKRNEFTIWTETMVLPFKFSSPYRIAAFFIRKGFETKLLMSQKTRYKSKAPLECSQVARGEKRLFSNFFTAYNDFLRRYIASNILDRKPNLSEIREALSTGSPAILLVDSYYTAKARGTRNPPHLPHWIVVTGYEGERFHINDSIHEKGLKTGKITMEGSRLSKAMDTHSRLGWPSALILVGPNRNKPIHCVGGAGLKE